MSSTTSCICIVQQTPADSTKPNLIDAGAPNAYLAFVRQRERESRVIIDVCECNVHNVVLCLMCLRIGDLMAAVQPVERDECVSWAIVRRLCSR